VINGFASDVATVVIGTVIDPEIGDELRVTVVATGLGGSHLKKRDEEPVEQYIHVVRNGTTGMVESTNEDDYDAVVGGSFSKGNHRGSSSGQQGRSHSEPKTDDMFSGNDKDMDYLDIPAFLRNQAD